MGFDAARNAKYVGKVVEIAGTTELFVNPRYSYMEALLSAVPITTPNARNKGDRIHLEGEIADPSNPPAGCYFHPRCKYAQELCKTGTPQLRDLGNNHSVACHFSEELALNSVQLAD